MKNKKCIAAVLAVVACAAVAYLLKKVGKKKCRCEDSYPDVNDEGNWDDPDIEKEFQEEE